MHLISISQLRLDLAKYANAIEPVENWHNIIKTAEWQNLEDARQIYYSIIFWREGSRRKIPDCSEKSGM